MWPCKGGHGQSTAKIEGGYGSSHTFALPHPQLMPVFAATDFHLGSPSYGESRAREQRVVRWLEHCAEAGASQIWLLGDTFDFWFEYRRAVPKGFTRLLGSLARLHDAGVQVSAWTGNHDMWIFDYLPTETGLHLYRQPTRLEAEGLRCLVGHGDGLGPGERLYKVLKKAFASPLCQQAFGFLHPNVGMWIAQNWSNNSRRSHGPADQSFKGEQEYIWQWAQAQHAIDAWPDLYLFGHRHLAMWLPVGSTAHYLNLGDWFGTGMYARLANGQVEVFTEQHRPVPLAAGPLPQPA